MSAAEVTIRGRRAEVVEGAKPASPTGRRLGRSPARRRRRARGTSRTGKPASPTGRSPLAPASNAGIGEIGRRSRIGNFDEGIQIGPSVAQLAIEILGGDRLAAIEVERRDQLGRQAAAHQVGRQLGPTEDALEDGVVGMAHHGNRGRPAASVRRAGFWQGVRDSNARSGRCRMRRPPAHTGDARRGVGRAASAASVAG